MRYLYILVLPIVMALQLSACSILDTLKSNGSLTSRVGNYSPQRLDNDISEQRAASAVTPLYGTAQDFEVVKAQNQQLRDERVTCTARVKKLLKDDRKGSPHQRFLIELTNGTTVLIAHNIDLAPYVPLQVGDTVTISGEYVWNRKGGVIHYTHHTTNAKHQDGMIQFNNQIYQ